MWWFLPNRMNILLLLIAIVIIILTVFILVETCNTDSDLSKVTVTKKVSLETFVGFLSQRQKTVCDQSRVTNCNNTENFSSKKSTVVIPILGLGNRLDVINSIYHLNLPIYWTRRSDFNCDYYDIFSEPKLNFVNTMNNGNIICSASRSFHWFDKTVKNITDRTCTHIYYPEGENYLNKNYDIISFSKIIPPKDNSFYKLLRPSKKVKDKIDSFFPKNEKLLGIHIRYSDNTNHMKQKTESQIFQEAINIINKYPNHKIFLASDNKVIKNKIINKYPNRVYFQNNSLNTVKPGGMPKERGSVEGMIEAVADLFALSYCDELWGNHSGSTFLKAAQRMKN